MAAELGAVQCGMRLDGSLEGESMAETWNLAIRRRFPVRVQSGGGVCGGEFVGRTCGADTYLSLDQSTHREDSQIGWQGASDRQTRGKGSAM